MKRKRGKVERRRRGGRRWHGSIEAKIALAEIEKRQSQKKKFLLTGVV